MLRPPRPAWLTATIHLALFAVALLTTLMAGAELVTAKGWFGWGMLPPEALLSWRDLGQGLPYAASFLLFLTCHEFGHYFTARYHRVRTSLPFYLPLFLPLPGALNIGSLGAVIMLKQVPGSTRKFFDIGIAGPLAGFVISIALLAYGFTHLPDKESYILDIHPEYVELFGGVPDEAQFEQYLAAEGNGPALAVGHTLLFDWLMSVLPPDPSQLPGRFELMHYPFIFVGYLTLFFTALNLLPIGQLDGGHIVYGLLGRKTSGYVARVATVALLFFGGTGLVPKAIPALADWESWLSLLLYGAFLVYVFAKMQAAKPWQQALPWALGLLLLQIALHRWAFPDLQVNAIWLVYTWMVVRFIKVDHPRAWHEHRVNRPRQLLGWLAMVIFVLCFSPSPIVLVGG
jgi:membrane-associated protease RseP (regulator of RpoE activity)